MTQFMTANLATGELVADHPCASPHENAGVNDTKLHVAVVASLRFFTPPCLPIRAIAIMSI